MDRTEYRIVREDWDNENLDAHGNPRRVYVESSYDDAPKKKAEKKNKYGIFWEDGYFQMQTFKSTGYGRMVYEDTYEEDVEVSNSRLLDSELLEMLKKGEVISVPVLTGEKKGSVMKLGRVGFHMNGGEGKEKMLWGLYYDGRYIYYGNRDILHGELVIPSSVKGLPIESVSYFGQTGITRLVLSEGIERIEEAAFFGCAQLEEIVFPKTIQYIGTNSFEGCSGLRRMVVPEEIRGWKYFRSWESSFRNIMDNIEEIARFEGDPQPEHDLFFKD